MRPTEYNYELADHIAFTISTSPIRLALLCEKNNDWPTKDTIVKWLYDHKEFADRMRLAIKLRDDLIIDSAYCDIFDLVDDESRPIEEIEAEVNRIRAKADELYLGDIN